MRKILIIEEALKNLEGHWFEYINSIRGAARGENIELIIAGQKEACLELTKWPEFRPVYRHVPWNNKKNIFWRVPLVRLLFHNIQFFFRTFNYLHREKRADVLFVPTVSPLQMLAWILIVKFLLGKKFDKIVLFFLTGFCIYKNGIKTSETSYAILFRFMVKTLSWGIQNKKVIIGVESEKLKYEFIELASISAVNFPIPVLMGGMLKEKGQKPILGAMGFARYEKGSDLILAALEILRKQGVFPEQFSFKIQWIDDFVLPDGSICKRPAKSEGIEIIDRPLTPDEYHIQMKSIDCMILPYRMESYYIRSSRVVIESAQLGIPIIVTKGTWLDEVGNNIGHVKCCLDNNPIDLSQRMSEIIENLDYNREQAFKKSSTARKLHSPKELLISLIAC